MKPTIIIGISSGIAAYKIVDLIKILKAKNINVEVIMTGTAVKMFGVELFENAAGKKVCTDLIKKDFDYKEVLKNREVEHIKLADKASVFIISPATANIIGKIANGIADDFLTTTLLATTAPVLICPSMNPHMWSNPSVIHNLEKLKQFGFRVLSPETGNLACGYDGVGRLPEIGIIASEIFAIMKTGNKLKGKKIIVTAGGTSEPIDKVRTITNRASGKMGLALAEECFRRGAEVLFLRASTSVVTNYPIKQEVFETGKDLELLIRKYLKDYNVLFHTAAVSDYKPKKKIDGKLDSKKPFTLYLESTVKILSRIKKWNPKIRLIGFKAVYKEKEKKLIQEGSLKLKESNADFIVVNDVGKPGIGFGVDENEVILVSKNGFLAKIEKTSKKEIAQKLLDYIFTSRSLARHKVLR